MITPVKHFRQKRRIRKVALIASQTEYQNRDRLYGQYQNIKENNK